MTGAKPWLEVKKPVTGVPRLEEALGEVSFLFSHDKELTTLAAPEIACSTETHFDYMGHSPLFPRVLQREFMRTGRNPTALASRIMERYGRPIYTRLMQMIVEGCEAGDFRPCEPAQTVTSIVGVIVFISST